MYGSCLLPARSLAAERIDGNLVSVPWLEKNLRDPGVLVLDVLPVQAYAAHHIPGAVSVFDPFNDLVYESRETPVPDMQELYRSWGISPGKKVVIYDQGGEMLATRLFFSLYYDGFPARDLFILDGGFYQWQQQGAPVTREITPVPQRGSFAIKKLNEDARAELPEFLAASGDLARNALLDAMGPDWHFGEVLALNKPGHIPNAISLPYTDLYHTDRTFKSAEEIGKMLAHLGVRPEQQIYTQCGGGVAGSVPFFAIKFILKYPRVKLFRGSEVGWLSDERDLPYWTYDAPFLMRDSNWLQWWGGRTIRTFGSAQVSIVDVRPPAAFAQGHVPFALNVPAEVFKNNIGNLDRLARILGAAGVHASDEAVVVSGAGLTKDSALAFLLLQKLGQKRVSVFMDSLDTWARLGFPVTGDATAVGLRKVRHDLSIPPLSYAADLRPEVIVTDPKSTHGLYPKVFVVSGKDVPAKAEDGKVVHVPYTDLLNADGSPKAAKDVWNILTQAGVPRYAELVCYSGDPGEAAANYFVLKLMGYPDVKVLVR